MRHASHPSTRTHAAATITVAAMARPASSSSTAHCRSHARWPCDVLELERRGRSAELRQGGTWARQLCDTTEEWCTEHGLQGQGSNHNHSPAQTTIHA